MIAIVLLLLVNIELTPVKSQKGFIHFPISKPEGKVTTTTWESHQLFSSQVSSVLRFEKGEATEQIRI